MKPEYVLPEKIQYKNADPTILEQLNAGLILLLLYASTETALVCNIYYFS